MTAPAGQLRVDDYAALCDKVRLLCGVDLMQYRRGQMERRVLTWVQRRGAARLGRLVIGTSEHVADPRALGLTPTHRCIYRKG